MSNLLDAYKQKAPEIIFEWNDSETEAQGWVVINSLRGGAAGGGTRMRKGLDKMEVMSLAKVMEIKFTVSGPAIGGAKSGINFDPNDPRRDEVLERWFKAVIPLLKNYYGTGGDLNVDEVKDVIPITEDYGLWHPQEGIVTGYFQPKDALKINLLGQLRHGVSKRLEDLNYTPDLKKKFNVADMSTGWGVAESVKHYYKIWHNSTVEGKRVVVQGWGNVASAAGYYLAQSGAKIVGIVDITGGLFKEEGLSFEEVKALFLNKKNNKLVADNLIPFDEANEKIWELPAEVFIPGAASKLVTMDNVEKLIATGMEVMSCGANVPFRDPDIFFGDTASYTDENISLIPDFIANCGMARVFAFLMQEDVEITDYAVFSDISNTIKEALEKVYAENQAKTGIAGTALKQALQVLMN